MKLFLLVWLFLFSILSANPADLLQTNDSADVQEQNQENSTNESALPSELQKVIYLSYEKVPQRVIKGEIFSVTIKTLSIVKDFVDITYELSNAEGLKILTDFPSRDVDSKYYYETFYFLATSKNASLPNFKATLLDYNNVQYRTTTLLGEKLNVISLNPQKDFSNIVANSFEISEYKTTNYDSTHNIVIFVANATNCYISALKLKGVYKQGIESVTESFSESKITYYAIIDKNIENLSFSYFNLIKNRFLPINIPIIVNDDSVTTQSDLKPKDQSREILKMGIAGGIALISFLMILWRKRYLYLIFIITPLAYIAYAGIPSKEICIKEGTNIHLLPVSNGTIFETTTSRYSLQKEDEVQGWVKIQLQNKKIGWVKNEDICSN
ncbi:MAG: hypothetical protein A2513_02050 [Sulfurimonas sp. RIFOXYD12_FULL_33_39]|uniref:hypothetical protein n=1 Tax=unclassified Sulfurimonas TaxID=2623549 RepID=UPI0008C747C4|nr:MULTISPECIES: hypothetical protein [unclassified Sulfurimonas]OHE01418.1 MAG: hypothetical protein A3G74_03705 [Sulfurimonas sp. RIFCSPLOWO2_12_FULL_34_6]OHE08777.1 MAG: hypothetical protein A2513_02050 [Sulfurimonas sp. RIFOXYD12_FULL_33_39]OHE14062.1 MAG: hypothetical protein A2530_03375 [Sulfurimonas sp. RIFOXYD2_FULL_34_21]